MTEHLIAHSSANARRLQLDWRLKGLPRCAEGTEGDLIDQLRLSLLEGHLMLPMAVLLDSSVRHNRAWMRRFLAVSGVKLCPHGKTTMSPELFRQQAEDGVWGMTAATAHHVRVYRHFGVRRILLANQLIGHADIEWVVRELEADPGFEFYCLVDSIETVGILHAALKARPIGRPLQVLLEIGALGQRAGVRSPGQGIEVGEAVRAAEPYLELRGVECFEGVFTRTSHAAGRVAALLHDMQSLIAACIDRALFAPGRILLSAGGSGFMELCAASLKQAALNERADLVLRSGCYITHDSGMCKTLFEAMLQRDPDLAALGEGLRPALEVWAYVQSTPEPGRSIATMGRRDVSYDIDPPLPMKWFRPGAFSQPQPVPPGYAVSRLFDQHACIDGPAGLFQVGDLIGFGVSHPCTTFDKWSWLPVVNDEYRVVSVITTHF
jgi:D-serine dehydratase